jgi:ribosomal protein L37E
MTSKFIPPSGKPDPRQMQQQMPDLSTATDIVCENCGNLTFQEVLLMKKVSALVSPNGKEGIVPIPTFSCVACGFVNEMFRPLKKVQPANEVEAPTEPTRPKLVVD